MYDVIVMKKNDRYYLSIPELVLSTSDKNLQKAFQKIEKKKEETILNMIEADLKNLIPVPIKKNNNSNKEILGKSFKQELLLFFYKCAFILFMIVGGSFLAYKSASRLMETYVYKIINIEKWSDQRVQEYTKRTRNMVTKLSPILDEFKIFIDKN